MVEKTYLVECTDETLQITIPENYKVTYGPVSPGSMSGYRSGNVLRVYESDTKQRAIFTNVVRFRDLSIPVKRLVKTEVTSAYGMRSEDHSETSAQTDISERWEYVE